MNIDDLFRKDENGNFVLSDEEILQKLLDTPSSVVEFAFNRIKNYLSIDAKVELVKAQKLTKFNGIMSVLYEVNNVEQLIDIFKSIDNVKAEYIDVICRFSDEDKVKLFPYLKNELLTAKVLNTIKSDELKKDNLHWIKSENNKSIIISSMSNDDYKAELFNEIKNDDDRGRIIFYMKDDKKKFPLTDSITKESVLKQLIPTFTDESMILDLIGRLSNIDNKTLYLISTKSKSDSLKLKLIEISNKESDSRYTVEILNSIEDFETYKNGFIILKDVGIYNPGLYSRINFFNDSEKIQLIPYILRDYDKERVVESIENDEDKMNLLDCLDSNSRWRVVASMKDNSSKIVSLNKLGESYYRIDVASNFDNDSDKIKAIEILDSESDRAGVIASLNDNDKKLELLNSIQNNACKKTIIKSLKNDEDKINILNNINDLEYRCELIPLINDEKLRVEQIAKLHDYKIILEFAKKLSDEGKKYLVESMNLPRAQTSVILLFDDDNEKVSLAKNIKTDMSSCYYAISCYVDEKHKIELLKMLADAGKTDSYNSSILENIEDDELFFEGIKYCGSFLSFKIENRIDAFDDDKKMQIIPFLKGKLFIEKLVENLKSDDNKMKCIKYLPDNFSKIRVIKVLSEENSIKCARDLIDSTIDLYKAKDYAKRTNYPMDKFEEMLNLEDLAINSEDNIKFRDNYLKLSGYASKYRVITHYNAKDENIDIVDEIINKFVGECHNISDRCCVISKLSDTAILEYREELNKIFDKGSYDELGMFDNSTLDRLFDSKKSKIIKEYKKLSGNIKKYFAKYIFENLDEIDESKIDEIVKLIFDVETSNSEEISKQSSSFISNLLSSDDSVTKFNKIENVFLTNNLPRFAKTYLTFLIVHPNFDSYKFANTGGEGHYVSSPVLNSVSSIRRKVLILTDLLKCSIKSNSINFVEYINKLEKLNELYLENKDKEFDFLDSNIKQDLIEFRNCILTLYDNYLRHKIIDSSDNALDDLNKLNSILCDSNFKSISDSVISGYCGLIGINSIQDAKKYMLKTKVMKNEESKNRYENRDFTIQQGDFIKGFDINYFFDMVQNGIVAKDYLGADMNTDFTALDTDLSRIYKDTKGMSINEIITAKDRDSGMFGQGYIILKDNPDKITITRKSDCEDYSRKEKITKRDMFDYKLEAFSNENGRDFAVAYGIRTGFSVSDIDYIVFDEEGGSFRENLYKITLPLAMNGIYIPVISKQTEKVLFTYEQFEELSSKMSGLKKYNKNEYNLSENIDHEEYQEIASKIDDSNKVIDDIKEKIFNKFYEGLGERFNIVNNINGKLEKREVQILDTGSTGRSTNIPYDGDFDFIVRIDRNIDIDRILKNNFIKNLISKFDVVKNGNNINGDIKEMVINIDGHDYKLDLSFVRKTDKVSYSTEMCVSDRLNTIKELYPDKYKLVLANIIYAKKYLKNNECYKKGQYGQGGLGGIGVENWILQNGGSFYDAAVDFISHAYKDNQKVSFDEFIQNYQIWDFGENFYTDRKNKIYNRVDNLHDNFISNNLTVDGYNKMCDSLKKFVFDYKFGNIKLDNEVNEVNDDKKVY